MTDDQLPDVPALRVHEPPPGGIAKLRARLDEEPQRRRWWMLALPAIAVAALIMLVVIRRDAPPPRQTTAAAPTALPDREVGGDVAFYWVASTPDRQNARMAPSSVPSVGAQVSITDAPQVGVVALP